MGAIGGIDAAEGECGRSRRWSCSGCCSVWMATVSRTSFDAPDPIASNAFILAWSVEDGMRES